MRSRMLGETRTLPMPDVAGWTEDERLTAMQAVRDQYANNGWTIVSEKRVHNDTFDKKGQRTTWVFVSQQQHGDP